MSSDGLARQTLTVGLAISLTVISVIIVGLRLYTRTYIVRNTGRDDYCMLAALFFALGILAAFLVMRENGMGYRATELSQIQITTTVKTVVAVQILYYLVSAHPHVAPLRTAMLTSIFEAIEITFERLCKGTIYIITTFCAVCIIVVLTQCVPLHKLWDFTGLVEGQCIDHTAFFYMTSSTNIIIDIWILILPVKMLLTISRPSREKVALIGIFALGIISCVASIVRLYSVGVFTKSADPFYDAIPINIWSQVEMHLGIWCASAPSLKALGSRKEYERKRMQHASSGYMFHGRRNTMEMIIGQDEFELETVQLECGRIVAKGA